MIKAFWFVFIQAFKDGWKHAKQLVKQRKWIIDIAKRMPPSSRWSTTPDSQVAKVRHLAQQHFNIEKQREFLKNVKTQLAEDEKK